LHTLHFLAHQHFKWWANCVCATLQNLILAIVTCTEQDTLNIVGNDRDAHHCIGSAGYSWCEKTAQCERPWELAKKEGFALTDKSFTGFCKK
jgi:hypothetical protein